jgi:phosphopentomutase
MKKFKRITTIVLDSVGIGAMPDCAKYNDSNTVNTLKNISMQTNLRLLNLEKLGLGNITDLNSIKPTPFASANYCMMQEKGDGKDTMTGHWEMMGCTLEKGFKQYVKNGFDEELILEFERQAGRKVIANKQASGMKVIKEYYQEHIDTGAFIVYTSVDSTFQIAAHEEVISLDELYRACVIARKLTNNDKYNVARVIARPFLGGIDDFYRTANRHDYALDPFIPTVMQKLVENNLESYCVGKISDIFNGIGVSKKVLNKSNDHGIDNTISALKEDFSGHLFVNLVDFDSLYGHPRDVIGYSKCLESFDARLNEIIDCLKEDDLLIITADHGNDPTYKGNDHTREYVPLLVYSKSLNGNNEIKKRMTFEDIGQTICENFSLENTKFGTSFLGELK